MTPMKIYSTQSMEEQKEALDYLDSEDFVSGPSDNTLDLIRKLARVFYVAPVQSSDLSVIFMN
jgi:hypothetical protein